MQILISSPPLWPNCLIENTHKRNEKKTYADTYEDTARKIEAMKSFQPTEDGGPKDTFLSVMDKEYPGRRRLYGRGVTNKSLKKGSTAVVPYVVPSEIMDTHIADFQKKLEADYAKKMEELNKSKESMVQEILEKIMLKLPPNIARESLA